MKRRIPLLISAIMMALGLLLAFSVYKNDLDQGTVFLIAWTSLTYSLNSGLREIFIKEKVRKVKVITGSSLKSLEGNLAKTLEELEKEKSMIENVQFINNYTVVILYLNK